MVSEKDRHWGTICLGIVTIATAAIGAALFGSDILDARIPNANLQAVAFLMGTKYGAAGLAIGFYVVILFNASMVIVPMPESLHKDGLTILQRVLRVYTYLVCELLALLLMLIANFLLNLLAQLAMPAAPATLLLAA